MIKISFADSSRSSISSYELGDRKPRYLVLYAYARLAKVYIDVLVDDKLDLPLVIPSDEKV